MSKGSFFFLSRDLLFNDNFLLFKNLITRAGQFKLRATNQPVANMTEIPNNLDNINWPAILLHLKKQKLVPFLGAGVSLVSNGTAGLPGAGRTRAKK